MYTEYFPNVNYLQGWTLKVLKIESFVFKYRFLIQYAYLQSMIGKKTRLQRKQEKESLRQTIKYLFLILVLLFLIVRFGLPSLINMATLISNLNSSNHPVEKQDQLAPLPPRLESLPEATFSAQIRLAGWSEAGSTVRLFVRGINTEETVADNNGNYEFKEVHLREGENEIYAIAVDDFGNSSGNSISYTVEVDNQKPELSINSPKDGDKFFDNDNPITITGLTESGINLEVNQHFVMVKSDGSFSTSLNLSDGDNEIEVIAIDKADNKTRVAIKVNYTP